MRAVATCAVVAVPFGLVWSPADKLVVKESAPLADSEWASTVLS